MITKKIEAIAIATIMVVSIFAGIIPTIATITTNSLSISPGVHFYGQNVTVTWTSDSIKSSYIWINANTSWGGNMATGGGNMTDDLTDVLINKTEVKTSSGSAPYSFTYTFANWSVNSSVQEWRVYINDTGYSTFPSSVLNYSLMYTNAYNVTFSNSRSAYDGNSTLAGDNITVRINTSGIQSGAGRDGKPFNITLDEGGSKVFYPYVNTADSGNYTFTINTTTAGVGAFRNITMSYGEPVNFSWNSTQLAQNASLWGDVVTPLQFNVSEVNLKAYDINGSPGVTQNITSVNITTLLGGSEVSANLSYPINITLTCDLSNLKFNNTGTPETFLNLTIPAGSNESSQDYGNYTIPANATLTSAVTSITTGTITATVNTSGMTWTDTFTIHPVGEYNKIEAPAGGTSYQIGQLVNITGWNATSVRPTLNITEVRTGATVLNSTVVTLNPIDNSFEYTWNTNWTWNTQQVQTWNDTYNKTGNYKIKLGNGSSDYYHEIEITLNENITVETNATSMPVNNSLWINGTTDRWNSNGTILHCNISTGVDRTGNFINGTLNNITSTFNSTTELAHYSILWNSRDNLTEIAGSYPVATNTFNGLYYITVNDSAQKNTTATFRITDSISVNPATGVPGYNFTATGTSARENGTVINVSILDPLRIPIRYEDAYVYNDIWNVTMNASYADTGLPLTTIEDYILLANDSIVKAESTLTMGEGVINLELIPDTTTMDGIVWFNGSTDMANGTWMWFNITTSTGKSINRTGGADFADGNGYAVVSVYRTFNASWQVNLSFIGGNFTAPVTEYTVNASNGSIYTIKTLTVNETLTITTPDFEIAPGCEFKIEGTLNRINGTQIHVVSATAAGTTTNTTTATVYGGEFNQTLTAKYAQGTLNLPKGDYTITVKDAPAPTSTGSAINASAYINMTVVTASVALTGPADDASYEVNQTVPISGTSNLGNNTEISVMITRTTGPTGWTSFTNSTITDMTNWTGHWDTTWDTTSDSTFQALSTKSGSYLITGANVTHSAYSVPRTITIGEAVLNNFSVSIVPSSVVVNVSTPVTVNVTDADSGAVVSGAAVSLSGCGVTASNTTDATGIATFDVNATSTGDITVTVSMTGYNDKTGTITVTEAVLNNFSVSIDPSSVVVNVSTPVTVNVTDADSGAAVSGATVSLSGCGVTDSNTTDATGIATFDVTATSTGDITVTVSKSGYNTKTGTITVTAAPVAEGVKINEFIAGPMTLETLTDWIELYNPTDADVDLTGWNISSPPGSSDITSLDGKTIAAGGYLALEGTGATSEHTFDFDLVSTGDIIILKNGTTVVDQVAYGDSDYDDNVADNALAPGADNSTGRDPNGVDTDVDNVDFSVFTTPTIGTDNTPSEPTIEVVINEFVSDNTTEWVELFNNGSTGVDLTGWTLEDEVGNSKSLSGLGTIAAGGYEVYTCASGWLNNDGDVILLKSETEDVDRVGYGDSGTAPEPDAGNSTGRYPNGVDTGDDAADFREFDTPTPLAENVVTAFDPWDYDEDGDEEISKDEVMAAINDYFDDKITKDQVLQVINLYFG